MTDRSLPSFLMIRSFGGGSADDDLGAVVLLFPVDNMNGHAIILVEIDLGSISNTLIAAGRPL